MKDLLKFTVLASIGVCLFVSIACPIVNIICSKKENIQPTLFEYWTDNRIS